MLVVSGGGGTMSRILVLGGGVVGLSTAVMLRRDGHDVIVLERDREARPASAEEAWHSWERSRAHGTTGTVARRNPEDPELDVRRHGPGAVQQSRLASALQ
jgi:glycine/D-amino acid oxidase-like deaminating enzyme